MIRNKKAFTLIEIILTVAIFAAIALPLFGVFVQSFKVDTMARGVLNANYIMQQYVEKLDSLTYAQALSGQPSKQATGGYYLSATIQPYGADGDSFVHLVALDGGKMLVVPPDGNWKQLSSVPSSVSLSIAGGQYTLRCDSTVIKGAAGGSGCTMILNAVKMSSSASPGLTLGSGCKAVAYCTADNYAKVSVASGDVTKYKNMFTGDTSLAHVTVRVYQSADASEPVAQSEAYINLRNW